jgi:hypothetical protein
MVSGWRARAGLADGRVEGGSLDARPRRSPLWRGDSASRPNRRSLNGSSARGRMARAGRGPAAGHGPAPLWRSQNGVAEWLAGSAPSAARSSRPAASPATAYRASGDRPPPCAPPVHATPGWAHCFPAAGNGAAIAPAGRSSAVAAGDWGSLGPAANTQGVTGGPADGLCPAVRADRIPGAVSAD